MITIVAAEDVTEEVLEDAREVVDGWYQDTRIDWEDVFERMERRHPEWDMGDSLDSPAIRKIKRIIRAERNNW